MRWVVDFTLRPHYLWGQSPRCPLNRRLGGSQSRYGHCPLPGIEPRSLEHRARSLDIKPTMLSCLEIARTRTEPSVRTSGHTAENKISCADSSIHLECTWAQDMMGGKSPRSSDAEWMYSMSTEILYVRSDVCVCVCVIYRVATNVKDASMRFMQVNKPPVAAGERNVTDFV